jgi:hypothetical protein
VKSVLNIAPCPFCASNLCSVEGDNGDVDQEPESWAVFCQSCGAIGPDSESIEDAMRLWAIRASMVTFSRN